MDSDTSPGRQPTTMWADRFGRIATRCVQIIAILLVTAVVVFVMRRLTLILIPVVVALIFASAANPVMSRLRRRNVPPLLATAAVLLSVLVVFGGVLALVTWAVQSQWEELTASADRGIEQLEGYLTDLPFGIDQEQLREWRESIVAFATSSAAGSSAIAGLSSFAQFVTGFVLMVIVLFFFLKDGPTIWEFLLRPLVGVPYERARRIGRHTVDVLGGYARGTTIVAAVDAVFIGIGLLIVQVPLAIPLAVVVFITSFIPIVGAVLAGLLAAMVALVTNGPVTALVVVGIVFVVNQLEGNFLQPVVMGRSLKLHALVILLALTAGSILGGVIGAVIAVPTAAVAWRIVTVWNGEDQPAAPMTPKAR